MSFVRRVALIIATALAGAGVLGMPNNDRAGAAASATSLPAASERPGQLLSAEPIAAPDGIKAWKVLYTSQAVSGAVVTVSGLVVAPADASKQSGRVLSWGHQTTGLADDCAPSALGLDSQASYAIIQDALGRGWTFVASDYEGLGTPGPHPYFVGIASGRNMLDIARAAAELDGAGVKASSPVALYGHSQGGHAALFAAELAPTYAPELKLVGAAAAAPPANVVELASTTSQGGGLAGFGLMIDAGFLAAYPSLQASATADAAGEKLLAQVAETCVSEGANLGSDLGPQPDPTKDPAWLVALEASTPGRVKPAVPLLITQGDADYLVVPATTEKAAKDYCALGADVQRIVYPGEDHNQVVDQHVGDVLGWLAARFEGKTTTPICAGG